MRKWEPRLLLLGAYFSFQILRVGNVLFLYEHGMYNLFCLAMFIWLKKLNWKKMKAGGDTCYIGHAKFWKRYDVTVDSWEEVFFKSFFFLLVIGCFECWTLLVENWHYFLFIYGCNVLEYIGSRSTLLLLTLLASVTVWRHVF